MNRRIPAPVPLPLAPLLILLALMITSCQALAGTPPPTPTPIMLPAQEGNRGQPAVDQAGGGSQVPARAVNKEASPVLGQPTTPPEEPASATPAPGAKIMVLGLRPSVTLRAAPDNAAQAVTTLSGARVLWAQTLSPDGKWLLVSYDDAGHAAWVSAGAVKVLGGTGELEALTGPVTPIPVAVTASPRKAPAEPALPGRVVFQTASGGDIYLVNANGSGLRRLTDGMDPSVSPDGKRLAFARWGAPHGIFVLDLQTGEELRVASASEPRSPTWSSDGSRLVFNYTTGSYTCLVSPFGCLPEDEVRAMFGGKGCITTPAGRLCIEDLPEQMVQEYGLVQIDSGGGGWQDLPAQRTVQAPHWQPNSGGEIVYRGDRGLQVTNLVGPTRPLVDDISLGSPAWSPDGQRLAVQKRLHEHMDIFLLDVAGNIQARLTGPVPSWERAPNNVAPAWSPDGRYILFLTDRDGSWRLYRMDADGSNQAPFLPVLLRDIPIAYDFAAERVISWGP